MNYYLIIPFVIILVAFIPIRLQIKISFNILDFSGAFGVFVFKKKVEYQQFWIKGRKILSKKEDEVESKEIEFDSREVIFLETLMEQIKDKTRLKELFVFYNIGFKDAFLSAIMAGYINTGLYAFLGKVKNSKPTATMGIFDTISYNREVCQFAVNSTLSISLFDVVYSLFNSVILSKKKHLQRKAESQNKNQNKG